MNIILFFGFFVVLVSGGLQDIDECLWKSRNECDSHAECINTPGSYTCLCRDGYTGDGKTCAVIKCKNLKPMGVSEVQNPDCIAEGSTIRVYTRCIFTCPPGYVFKKIKLHTLSRYCNHHGKWTGEDDICIDIYPPRFTSCPSQKVLNTAFRRNVAKNVIWKTPTYYDNSVPVEGGQLTLVEKNGYTSPRDFGIGKHRIEYTVTDKSGLKDFCFFTIIVKDIEPPYYTYCPADIHKTYSEDGVSGMRIFWRPAAFADNSGIDPTVRSSPTIRSLFPIGISEVTYTAVDSSGNVNRSCSFQVILKDRPCVKRNEPKNGALACFNTGRITYCNPFCPEGYEFSYKPEGKSFCYRGEWQYWVGYRVQRSRRQEWPDCIAHKNPSNGNPKMSQSFYYHGDCLNNEVQNQLKLKFHTYLTTRAPVGICRLLGERCKPANMEIYCGVMTC